MKGSRFLWIIAVAPLVAQTFQGLSTNDDGSVLYFSSTVREKGFDQSFHSKIFRWDAAGGMRVMAEIRDTGETNGCTTSNFYKLQSPQVSSDGAVLSYTASRPESSGRFCPANEANQAVIQRLGIETRLPGKGMISPNGRYAITSPMAAVINNFHIVTDLASSVSKIVAGAFSGSAKQITDDATVVTAEQSAVKLVDRNGETRIFETTSQVDELVIDHSGKTVVYGTHLAPAAGGGVQLGRIASIDVATGLETNVLTGLYSLSILTVTGDGASVVFTGSTFTSGSQSFIIGIRGGVPRPIPALGQAGANALSGNGLVAYSVTGPQGVIRIEMTSGAVTEVAPATPRVTEAYRVWPADGNSPGTTVAALGSLMEFRISGGFGQITLCGRSVPNQFGSFTGGPRIQVPWDLPEGPCQATVQSNFRFEAPFELEVKQYDPQFEAGLLLHDNFRAVTSSSPAHPGDIIVAFMTGLGPVNENGMVKPGFICTFNGAPGDILYAGVAPGLDGQYQVNVRAPNNLHGSSAQVFCGWDLDTRAGTSLWLGPL